jgi:hypothetical protein
VKAEDPDEDEEARARAEKVSRIREPRETENGAADEVHCEVRGKEPQKSRRWTKPLAR